MSLDVPEIATKVLDCMDVQAFELRTLAPGTYSIFNVDVNSENLLGTFTETWSSFDPSQFVVVPGGLLSISVGRVIGEFVPASGATQSFNLQVYRLSIVSGTPSFLGSGFVERTFATRLFNNCPAVPEAPREVAVDEHAEFSGPATSAARPVPPQPRVAIPGVACIPSNGVPWVIPFARHRPWGQSCCNFADTMYRSCFAINGGTYWAEAKCWALGLSFFTHCFFKGT
ncbi:hypothetical protein J4558_14460 [Leptolyngbya sp. 15MV]|nr:hypothetical protein J4558_14460 [Leptolyngbya sp. 15MV]